MSLQVTGRVNKIGALQQVTEKFSKRELWLNLDHELHPQVINIEFTNKLCDRLDDFAEGDEVKITFALRGRIWKDKCFTSMNGYVINPVLQPEPPTTVYTPVKQGEMANYTAPATAHVSDAADDLPF